MADAGPVTDEQAEAFDYALAAIRGQVPDVEVVAVSALWRNEQRAVICSVQLVDGEYEIRPLALMLEEADFEEMEPPDGATPINS